MSAPFSIIIPTLNAGSELPDMLNSLLPGVEQGLIAEVIISDGGSTDNTLEIADEAGAVIVKGAASRGGQLRRGADVAKAEWFLFLHADTHLPRCWPGALGTHIVRSGFAAAFRLSFRNRSSMACVTAAWANLRSRHFELPYGDQGLLISRALYDEIGGYPDLPLMEDVAFAQKLRGRLILLEETVTTSAEKYVQQGWIRRGARNIWTLVCYKFGASPQALATRYHKP